LEVEGDSLAFIFSVAPRLLDLSSSDSFPGRLVLRLTAFPISFEAPLLSFEVFPFFSVLSCSLHRTLKIQDLRDILHVPTAVVSRAGSR
jgi:hypothetical protein